MRHLRPRRDDRGAAAVEFALVLPVLLLLILGIIEFGFAFNAQISLTQAVREGVRVEALDTGDAVETTQNAFLGVPVAGPLNEEDIDLVATCSDDNGGTEDPDRAHVSATLEYRPIVLPMASFDLHAQAVMRCGG